MNKYDLENNSLENKLFRDDHDLWYAYPSVEFNSASGELVCFQIWI